MKQFDLIVIGGGIIGCAIFNQAVRQGINAIMLEAGSDVSMYSTKANSGIVHAGYNALPGMKRAIYNVRGNKMYPAMCKRLGVPLLRCGSLVVAKEQDRPKLQELLERGIGNGVKGLRIVEREELHTTEPNLADDIDIALFSPSCCIVSPYSLCVALAEEGIINGGTVKTEFEVTNIKRANNLFIVTNGKEEICGKYLVNSAGQNANEINGLVGAKQYPMRFVKGQYILLDKSENGVLHHPIFPLPTEKGKGIIANITAHGNILLGPTAEDCEKTDLDVTQDGINQIKANIPQIVKNINFKKTIKLFAGIRVKTGDDFVIERDDKVPNYYYTLGICSPGLSSAPAIAEDIVKMIIEDGLPTKQIKLKKRTPYVNMQELSIAQQNKMIKQNSVYGKIICRCEKISEGEILDALNSPLRPTNIDAIKRRCRPTMGRCQGGFCRPKLIQIISNHCKIKPEDVTLNGEGSEIVIADIKEGGIYEK